MVISFQSLAHQNLIFVQRMKLKDHITVSKKIPNITGQKETGRLMFLTKLGYIISVID